MSGETEKTNERGKIRPLDSLHPAVARATRTAMLVVLLAAIATFTVGTEHLTYRLAAQVAEEQARLLGIALAACDEGEVSACFDRIRAQTDTLMALAVLEEDGSIQSLLPEQAEFRMAVAPAVRATGPLATNVMQDDELQPTWAIRGTVRTGESDAGSLPAIFLLRRYSHLPGWAVMCTVAAAAIAVVTIATARLVGRWFDRRILRPLQGLATLECTDDRSTDGSAPLHGGWREIEGIATKLDELVREAHESRQRIQRLERSRDWELKKTEAGFNTQLRRVRTQATTDPLTQLKNRAFMDEVLPALVSEQRAGGNDLAVVMIDIDNFKFHNDTRGHHAGDELLKFVGELLRGSLRPSDHAIRYGGDEFTLVLPGCDVRNAVAIAERIVKLFAQYASRIPNEKPLSMSAGVASLTGVSTGDPKALLAAADAALYSAKRQGKNTVATTSQMVAIAPGR